MALRLSHPAALAVVVTPGVMKEPGDRVCVCVQMRVYAPQIM